MSVLTVEDLRQQFLDKTLYDDTGFALNQEDHMGIIGQNGVGKSTLIKIITGQILPDNGKITWKKHTKIGYLDQYVSLTAQQSIFEFLKQLSVICMNWMRKTPRSMRIMLITLTMHYWKKPVKTKKFLNRVTSMKLKRRSIR
ncbi:ATP-binding cassette domain-containing protein [Loigolactobacillus coryniformis]|uniref:ATP-binding cassette domain-containing protein n=1 Tax=Loigolactobacillus coryniformis TaxID=1610 RepID=UPI00296B08DC|nr:ATP-binding cassette domain-containing protein [Loigolactobacillus coryniformis]